VGFGHVEAALALLARPAGTVDVPGHRLERIGGRLVLTDRPHARQSLFQYPLSIPGEACLREVGRVISAEVRDAPPAERPSPGGPVAIVRRDLCRGPLAVRNRRPGDRFRPIGLDGRKKLQDFFVDRKVARAERDRVPIVVDAADRIVWVAGHGIDAAFRVTDASQGVLIFKVKHLGGSA
jgi:tRNA(Ile)-lysidine synthase